MSDIIKYMEKNSNLIKENTSKHSLRAVIGERLKHFGGRSYRSISVKDKDKNIEKILSMVSELSNSKIKGAKIFNEMYLSALDGETIAHLYDFCSTIQTWEKISKSTDSAKKDIRDLGIAREEIEKVIEALDATIPMISEVGTIKPEEIVSEEKKAKELVLALNFMGIKVQKGQDETYAIEGNSEFGFHYKDENGVEQVACLSTEAAQAFCDNYLNKNAKERPNISVEGVFKYFVNQQNWSLKTDCAAIFSENSTEWQVFKLTHGNDLLISDAISSAMAEHGKELISEIENVDKPIDFSDSLESKFSNKGRNSRRIERIEKDMGEILSGLTSLRNAYNQINLHNDKQFDEILKVLAEKEAIYRQEGNTAEADRINDQIIKIKENQEIYETLKGATQLYITSLAEHYRDSGASVLGMMATFEDWVTIKDGQITFLSEEDSKIFGPYIEKIQRMQQSKATNSSQGTTSSEKDDENMLPDVLAQFKKNSNLAIPEGSMAELFTKGAQYERLMAFFNMPEPNNIFKSLIESWKIEKNNNLGLTSSQFIANIRANEPNKMPDLGVGEEFFGNDSMLAEALDAYTLGVEPKGLIDTKMAYYYMDLVAKEIASTENGLENFENASSIEKNRIVSNFLEQIKLKKPTPTEADLKAASARWAAYHNFLDNGVLNSQLKESMSDASVSPDDKSLASKISQGIEKIMANNRNAIENLVPEPKVDYQYLDNENAQQKAKEWTPHTTEYGQLYPREKPQNEINKMFKGYNVKYSLKKLSGLLKYLDKQKVIDNAEDKYSYKNNENKNAEKSNDENLSQTQPAPQDNANLDAQVTYQPAENNVQENTGGLFKYATDKTARGIIANQFIFAGISAMINKYLSTDKNNENPTLHEEMKEILSAMFYMTNPSARSDIYISVVSNGVAMAKPLPEAMLSAFYAYATGDNATATDILNKLEASEAPPRLIEGLKSTFHLFTPEQLLSLMLASSNGNFVNGQATSDWNFGGKISDEMLTQFKGCQNIDEVRKMIVSTPELAKDLDDTIQYIMYDKIIDKSAEASVDENNSQSLENGENAQPTLDSNENLVDLEAIQAQINAENNNSAPAGSENNTESSASDVDELEKLLAQLRAEKKKTKEQDVLADLLKMSEESEKKNPASVRYLLLALEEGYTEWEQIPPLYRDYIVYDLDSVAKAMEEGKLPEIPEGIRNDLAEIYNEHNKQKDSPKEEHIEMFPMDD